MIRALTLAMLMLSACAPLESMKENLFPSEETAASDARVAPSPSEPIVAEVPPLPQRKPGPSSDLALAEADPERLVGLDFDATKALLGDPERQLEQPPAKIWAYDGGACMLNVFFYPSVDDKVFRVLAYEVTDETPPSDGPADDDDAGQPVPVKIRDKGDPIARRCFADLLHNKPEPNAG